MSRRSFNVRSISNPVRSGGSVSGKSGGSSGGSSQPKSTSTPKGSSGSSASGSKTAASASHAREVRQTTSPSKVLSSPVKMATVSQPSAKIPTPSVARPASTPTGSGKSPSSGNSSASSTSNNSAAATPRPVADAPRTNPVPRVDSYVKSTPTPSASTTSGGTYYSPTSVAQSSGNSRATSSNAAVRSQGFISGVQSKASTSSASVRTTTVQELQHNVKVPTNPVNSTLARQEYQKTQLPFANNAQQIVEAKKAAQTESVAKKAAAQAASKSTTSSTSTKSTSNSSSSSTSSTRTMKVANGKKTITVNTPNLGSAQREGLDKTLDKLGVTQAQRDYVNRSVEQLVLGNYSDEVTLLGTGLQVATAFVGLDLPGDVRDVIHDITHWENSKEHAVKTLIDAAGILPVVGVIGKLDEVAAVAKAMKPIMESTPLGKNILKIGTQASELSQNGKKIIQNGAQIIRNIPRKSGKTFMRLAELVKKQGQNLGQNLGRKLGDAFAPEPIMLSNGTLAMMPTPGSALYSAANQMHKGTISLIEKSKDTITKKLDSLNLDGKNLRGIGKESSSYVKNTDEISASKNISKNADANSAKKSSGLGEADDIITDGSHITWEKGQKVLQKNVKYKTDAGYLYNTDTDGRITGVSANLKLGKGIRNFYAQKIVGGANRIRNLFDPDHGGHLIARQFFGSGDIDNLVAMNGKLNIKEWRNLERQWEKALKEGKEVIVDIKVNYVGDSLRPDSFDIVYQIGDEKTVLPPLMNVKGGK